MRKKTSRYTLLLMILSSILMMPSDVFSQNKKSEDKKEEMKVKFYQGSSIGLEIASPINYLLGSDILSSEIIVQSNILNRYMPVIEIGFGKTDSKSEATDIHYKTAAPYYRIGMDYNFFHDKTHLPGYIYGGIRYGISSFIYDVDAPDMFDQNYNEQNKIPFSYHGVKTTAQWLEIVAGMKVKIYKSFSMGWNVKYKKRLTYTKHQNTEPWYIPGFGKNGASAFTLSYNLIYNLPF